MTAVFINEKIKVDGRLDEPAWQMALPATDFYQQEPDEGELTTERSEVRFLYDRQNLYVGAVLYDSEVSGAVTNELKRDFNARDGDLFCLVLDTFHDRRNSYSFMTNPGGGKREIQTFDQAREINSNWDTVWYVRTTLGKDRWFLEMAIPFKSLRIPTSAAQVWGLQVMRLIRQKAEVTMWSPVPRQWNQFNMAYAGELHGLEQVRPGRSLRVTPFLVTQVGTGPPAGGAGTEFDGDGGVDVKYGIGTSLVLDATYRTDFAQVEIDEQQINLTRFSLFFPEKRSFFLENSGVFQIGDRLPSPSQTPRGTRDFVPFFTRRIGLSATGDTIPIVGGARLTGKIGRTQLGLLGIQTEEYLTQGSNNYAVARVNRELFGNSSVGGFFFNRDSNLPDNYNRVAGLDFKLNFLDRALDINAYLMKSYAPNVDSGDVAGRLAVSWKTNKSSAVVTATTIGNNFQDDLGFIARTGVRIFTGEVSQKFRPRATYRWVREYVPKINYDLLTDLHGEMLTRFVAPGFSLNFAEGSSFTIRHDLQYEQLLSPFQIRPTIAIPAGSHEFGATKLIFSRHPSHRFSGNASYTSGTFYDGNIKGWELGGRLRQSERLAMSLKYGRNDVTLPNGEFATELASLRADYSFSPRMFLNAFVQYNSQINTVLTNIRFRFIYRPLSDLFIVYTRAQSTNSSFPTNQALILKFTRLFDF